MPNVPQSLIIATMQRTGSSWLSSQLRTTGLAGNPREWLQPETILRWGATHRVITMKAHRAPQLLMHRAGMRTRDERLFIKSVRPHSLPRYMDSLIAAESTPNGVFAMQCHWDQWTLAHDRWSLPMTALGDRRVWLHHWREDRFEQAVSWTIARQSNRWNSTMTARGDVTYDAESIRLRFELAERYHRNWLGLFEANGIEPLLLTYERLMAEPAASLATILGALDVEPVDEPDAAPVLQIQRDERSDEWVARFAADHPELIPRRFARLDED